jgi:polysaccharide pyruvyl transferase WcaK-like protein
VARDPINICILGATFNTPNLGVSVLAAGALRCILHKFPDAIITQFDYAQQGYAFQFPYTGREVNIRFTNIRFSKKLYLPNNIAVLLVLAMASRVLRPLAGLRRWLLFHNWSLKQLQEADLVVSLAGGDSFSDIYGLRRLVYISLPQILALLLNRRLILLPQTIGPFEQQISRRIARFVLNRAELIYCRDRMSEKATRHLLGVNDTDTKLRFCYDVGFDVTPKRPKHFTIAGLPSQKTGDEVLVGFNVSGLLAMGGYSQNNMFGLSISYEQLVLRLISFMIEEHSATVLLIPHVFGTSGENDVAACEHIFSLLRGKHEGKIGLLLGVDAYNEVKHVIGTCDFFIGSRMHACIGALSQSVPAVSIAYSDKFAGVMESIGVPDLVVDPRVKNEEQILRAVGRAFQQRLLVREELNARMPLVKQTIQEVLRDLEFAAHEDAAVAMSAAKAQSEF